MNYLDNQNNSEVSIIIYDDEKDIADEFKKSYIHYISVLVFLSLLIFFIIILCMVVIFNIEIIKMANFNLTQYFAYIFIIYSCTLIVGLFNRNPNIIVFLFDKKK